MSSDSHSDDHSHSTSPSDDHGHDSHDSHDSHHAPAADVIPDTSWQDWMLKGLTIVAAGLLYFMAFCWMAVPLAEAGHEAGSEHGQQHGTSEHSAPEHSEGHH